VRGSKPAVAALALAAWAAVLSAQPAPADSAFGEQIDVDVVNVEVYVTGEDGRPVTGLERGDFTLSEDGKPMRITNFAAVDPPAVPLAAPEAAAGTAPEASPAEEGAAADPLYLAVFIDNTQVTASHRSRVLRQLRDLLTRRLAPGDLVLLATFDPGLHVRLPFTADRTALAAALDAVQKVAADSGSDTRARRFAWQQVLQIRELAFVQMSMESKGDGGGGRREESGDQAGGGNRNGSEGAGPCPLDIADPVKAYAWEALQRVLGSIGGLNALASSLSGLSGRKALLHISDGISVTPGEDLFRGLNALCADAQGLLEYHGSQASLDAQTYSTAKAWSDLAARASAQRVTFYTLQASGLEGSSAASAEFDGRERFFQAPEIDRIQRENRRGSLVALADGTGGRAILDANDLAPDVARIEDDFGHYYSLGYAPAHQPAHQNDGRDHTIRIKVDRAGARVRHRKVYRDLSPLERVVDHTYSSLVLGNEDNPLGIKLEVGAAAPAGRGLWALPVRLSIPLSRLGLQTREDSFDGKLRVLVIVSGADGERTPIRQVEVPIRIPRLKALVALGQYYVYEMKMTLRGGEQRLAVTVRDEATTTTSYLARMLQVGAGL